MPITRFFQHVCILVLVLSVDANCSKADFFIFLGNFGGGFAGRLNSQGQLVQSYDIVDLDNVSETYDDWALDSSFEKLYILDNNLGLSQIITFDIPSNTLLDFPFEISYDSNAPNSIIQGHAAEVSGGYLYVVSNANFAGGSPNFASIRKFDTTTGEFVSTSPFLPNKPIFDMRNGYILSDGVYLGDTQIIAPVAGDNSILFGPDNLLYVTNSQAQEVRRYAPDGSFVDVFLTSSDIGGMTPQSSQFASNGDLYVLGKQNSGDFRPLIKRFDGVTSNYVSTALIDENLNGGSFGVGISGFNDRFYILVPEPATLLSSVFLLTALSCRQSRRCQHG